MPPRVRGSLEQRVTEGLARVAAASRLPAPGGARLVRRRRGPGGALATASGARGGGAGALRGDPLWWLWGWYGTGGNR